MALLQRKYNFIPKFGDNDKLDSLEQFSVIMKPATVEAKNSRITKFLNADPKKLMAQMMEREKSTEILALLKDHVVGFNNLEVEEDGEKKAATIDDLWAMGEFQLCLELFMHILSHSSLAKEKEKNSESPSGSPQTNGENEITTVEPV